MNTAAVIDITLRALQLTLLVIAPVIAVSIVVGFLVAFLQAITQIQDQSIGMAVRVVAIFLTLLGISSWMGVSVFNFAQMLFNMIPNIGVNPNR